MRPRVGLLPAAGSGTRLRPYRSPKELLPILVAAPDKSAVPVPLCHFALERLKTAGVERALVVISEEKTEIVRVLGDGAEVGIELAYLVQREALGLTHVVRCAEKWLAGADVLFALPDTLFFPENALLAIAERLPNADLALAVFPTEEAERLAPIELDGGGAVRAIHDKPKVAPVKNTWGALAWTAKFTEFCSEWDRRRGAEPGVLSFAMEAARKSGFKVEADYFERGAFRDLGTQAGLASAVELLIERGVAYR